MRVDTTEQRRLLSIKDAARCLGVGERQVWALLARGEMASVKIGRRRLIDARDLDAFIERCKEAARAN